MNSLKTIFVLLIFMSFISCQAQEKSKDLLSDKMTTKIEVYNFHSTHRCVTCKAIEANTRYTLEKYFVNDMKKGKITLQVVNVDDSENEKLAEKFEATGTSLFLNVIKDGKDKQIDLTEFAFMHGKDKVNFSTKLRRTIKEELQKL